MGIQLIAQIFSIEWVNEALENYSFLFYKTAFIRILMLASIFLFVKNEHDIVVYTLVMSLSTLINYLISCFWIKKDIKLVKIHISDFKPLFLPLTAMLVFANANMPFTFLDRLFLVKTGIDVNVSYYLGKGDKEAYVSLVNRGSRFFNFFIIPLSFGLMVLGPNAILLYGSEKYIGGGILTSLFAFRTIILALDTILGSQILFTNGYEKRITVYTVFAGLLNLGLNSLLFFNHIVAPEYYLLTTMLSEASLLVFYIIFIHRKQLIHLGHIFSYTVRYSLFSLSFVGIYFLINFLYPVDMIINLPFLINTGLIVLLSAISYIGLLVFTKDSIFYEFLNHVLALKNRFKRS